MKIFPPKNFRASAAFTMVEIALCLAIIGFALVALIAVLPYGMNTQRANREETVINQDAAVLLPLIAHGSRGADDLTNYVYAVTNSWTLYNANGAVVNSGQNGYSFGSVSITSPVYPAAPYSAVPIYNGANIVALLSTPEFIANVPTNYPATPNLFNAAGCYSNHVVAYIRSMSGLAAEKPPQDNTIMVGDTFSYRILCVNAPVALDTNTFNTPYNKQLSSAQHELRLTFAWPLLPSGQLPSQPTIQTFRTTIAGQLALTLLNGQWLYFYQQQSFVNAP